MFAVQEMVDHPFETKSDSFYFVDSKLVMHNKADYAYNGWFLTDNIHLSFLKECGFYRKTSSLIITFFIKTFLCLFIYDGDRREKNFTTKSFDFHQGQSEQMWFHTIAVEKQQ